MSSFCDLNSILNVKEEPKCGETDVCRICVKSSKKYHCIFRDNLQERLYTFFGIYVNKTDTWPKYICKICYDQMKIAVKFLIKIRSSEKILYNLLGNLKQINLIPDIEIVNVQENFIYDQDDFYAISEDENSNSSTKYTKIVKYDTDDSVSNELLTNNSSNGDYFRSDPLEILKSSTTNSFPENDAKWLELNKNIRYDKVEREKQLKRIEDFFKMDCNLCGKKCSKLQDLQTHFRKEHNQKAYVVCCKSKFKHRCKIEEHMELHLNPSAFKCVECGKLSRTKYNLHLHMKNSHTPREFHTFICEKCPATFMTMERYKKHAFVHLPEDKKINKCSICNKAFSFKANLRIHIEQVHNKKLSEHICEVCAKIFNNREIFHRHLKTHSKERMKKFSCNTCDKMFVHDYHLKRHMLRHNDSGEAFVCHICGKNAPNGPALNAHINYVHVKEKKHKCTQCENAFKTPRALKQHIICLHSGEVLYTCIFCYKRFKCRTSKYFHQKHQHPTEYKEFQEKKNAQ